MFYTCRLQSMAVHLNELSSLATRLVYPKTPGELDWRGVGTVGELGRLELFWVTGPTVKMHCLLGSPPLMMA